MARHKHGPPHEEHADETWLVPYSDLLTLLLALFIVLFASSQVDAKKFAEVAGAMQAAFANPFTSAPGGQYSMKPPGGAQPQQEMSAVQLEMSQLAAVKAQLDNYIKEKQLNGQLDTVITDQGLVVRIRDQAFFASGSAALYPEAQEVARKMAEVLMQIPQQVVISGHTDNMPINTGEFPSNWDLSSKRALNVMKYMLYNNSELNPERFSAIGYGEYRPLGPNTTEEGRAKNRRVEVLIVRGAR